MDPRASHLDKASLLSRSSLFSGLSSWELQSIGRLMRLIEFRRDEVVYQEGTPADSFYVIASGRFEAFANVAGKKKTLAYLRRGDYFGEMSILTGDPHSATLRALSDAVVLELKKDDFKRVIENNAVISLELSRRLSARLSVKNPHTRSLFRSDVIGVCSFTPREGAASFSLNLAASLSRETGQKTALVWVDTPASDESRVAALPRAVIEKIEHEGGEALTGHVFRHPAGFDVFRLDAEGEKSVRPSEALACLNALAAEYRFIVVDLPPEADETSAKILSHSDRVFCVADSRMNGMAEARDFLLAARKESPFSEDRFAVVVCESAFGARPGSSFRREFFGDLRSFALVAPPVENGERAFFEPPVARDPSSEYARGVRHIARWISHSLVGLVLGSGAALGLAHIGIIKVLERENIPIDIIAGSSIGALIGSLYAVGKTAGELEAIALGVTRRMVVGKFLDFSLFPLRGFLHGRQAIKHFNRDLGGKTFEDCVIPLRITGANLSTREVVTYESGSISDAVRASIAIPAIFKPIVSPKRETIVDGGILSPLPIRVVNRAGANKVIAVNVFRSSQETIEQRMLAQEAEAKENELYRRRNLFARGYRNLRMKIARSLTPNIFDVLMNTIQQMESEIADVEGEMADVLLRPVLPSGSWMEVYHAEKFIRRGEEEAVRLLPKIKTLVSQQNV